MYKRTLTLLLFTISLSSTLEAKEETVLGRARVESLINSIIERIETRYVDLSAGPRVVEALKENFASGSYDNIRSEREFAAVITTDMREISRDLHLAVRHSSNAHAKEAGQKREPKMMKVAKNGSRDHFAGLQRPEGGFFQGSVLEGGVGLIEFSSLLPPLDIPAVREDLQRALVTVKDESHIIFDARSCRGGVPETVASISSNLYGRSRVLLNTYVNRITGNRELYTVPTHAIFDGDDKTFYVLTSKGTGSGAEAFAYMNQQHGRLTVVGERTAGAGRASVFYPISENLSVLIPENESIHPISRGNFEKVGVQPDVESDQRLALHKAHQLALTDKQAGRPWSLSLRKALRNVQAGMDQVRLTIDKELANTADSSLAGHFAGDRRIWVDARGSLLYQRQNSVVFNLVPRGENLYKLDMSASPELAGRGRELPDLQFVFDESRQVTGIAFLFKDGRMDGPFQKLAI